MQLCEKTIMALEAVEEIPAKLLSNANSDMIANTEGENRPPVVFFDEYLGVDIPLDFTTCLYVAEQLYRFQTCTETLALMVNGKFGELLTRMMVNSLSKQKNRKASETKFVHRRTSFSNKRSLMDEIDVIQETAQCILFGAVDTLKLIVPISFGNAIEDGSTRWKFVKDDETGEKHYVGEVKTAWKDFFGYCPISGQEIRCAAMFDDIEHDLLCKIIEHNQNHGPHKWQFITANARKSDGVNIVFGVQKELYGDEKDEGEDIMVIRRVLSTLRRASSNCIMAAFGAAVARFFILEYGHNTEHTIHLEEHHKEKFARHNQDMITLEVREQFDKELDDIDRLIVDISESLDSSGDVFDKLTMTMEKPISRATFYRRWGRLKELAEKLVLDLT